MTGPPESMTIRIECVLRGEGDSDPLGSRVAIEISDTKPVRAFQRADAALARIKMEAFQRRSLLFFRRDDSAQTPNAASCTWSRGAGFAPKSAMKSKRQK